MIFMMKKTAELFYLRGCQRVIADDHEYEFQFRSDARELILPENILDDVLQFIGFL